MGLRKDASGTSLPSQDTQGASSVDQPTQITKPEATRPWTTPIGERIRKYGLTVMMLVLLFGAWELISRSGWQPEYILPAPSDIAALLWSDRAMFWDNAAVTLVEVGLGFAIGIAIGGLVGAAIAMIPPLQRAIYPLVVASQSLPMLALAPLLVLWFGYGIEPKVILTVQVVFFPVAVATISGLTSVSPEILSFGRSLGASWWKLFWKVRVPASLPYVFSGLKIAASYGAIAAVIAEWSGANRGLGALMLRANNNLNTEAVFGCLVLITAIGVGSFALVSLIESKTIPWHTARQL